ncbi:MAG: reverse transcriptase domain-containing protein [Armatimonadota bacterium]
MKLLHKRIRDDRFLKLIAKFLKAGYFEREMWNPSKKGTPQGGIISPVLANIYLHEMDRYVVETFGANKKENQTPAEVWKRIRPEYRKLNSDICYTRRCLADESITEARETELREKLRKLLKERKSAVRCSEPIKPKLTYVRYADDWVLVLRSLPKLEAERIREYLTKWLWENLRLTLSSEKTKITHISDGFTFLGYKIIARKESTSHRPRVKLLVPFESINEKIAKIREICKRSQDAEVEIIRHLNHVMRGWMNFYICASAPSRAFNRVITAAFWAYGNYVAKKHDMPFSQAAQKWIRRCPPTRQNPKGGQKSWLASFKDSEDRDQNVYLICAASRARHLVVVARQTLSRGNLYDGFGQGYGSLLQP